MLQSAKQNAVRSVNQTMVTAYFEIGKKIVKEEQNGQNRAEYGQYLLIGLSERLTTEFGKGFSTTNLKQMRQFYQAYSIGQTASDQLEPTLEFSAKEFNLSWSHYLKLMRIEDQNERDFYEMEAFKGNWSVRELQRQYDSALYSRLALSRNKEKVLELAQKGLIIEKPSDVVKDPYILEFLGLSENVSYSESELEQELINKLEHFLLELGNGFTFVARQERITF